MPLESDVLLRGPEPVTARGLFGALFRATSSSCSPVALPDSCSHAQRCCSRGNFMSVLNRQTPGARAGWRSRCGCSK